MIPRPEPSERISRNNSTFSEIWLRMLYGVRDAVTGAAPPQVPAVTVAQAQRTNASPAGQLIYVTDEAGGAVLAVSDGTNWRRQTDRAVIS